MGTRRLIVEVVGDSRSLQRTFSNATRDTRRFGTEIDRTSSRFTRLNQSLSGGLSRAGFRPSLFSGFLGTAAVAAGIKSVVSAAAESQQVLGQTKVALDAAGKSWEQYGNQIQVAVAKQSKLGFDDEALLRTFSLFVRSTGDVTQALRLNALAADVARGRYIDLETAANLVNKAAIGQGGALRRLGIDVRAGASAQELLTALTAKYGGAAQAAGKDASTAFDRAKVSIENAKESIGGNLLPTVAGLANTLSDTLELFTQLGNVKVPPIHIPLIFDQGDKGTTLGDLAHKLTFTLPEFVDLTKGVVGNLVDDFKDQTAQAAPDAAKRVGVVFSDFIDNVLVSASTLVNPKVNFGDLLQNVLAGTVDASGFVKAVQDALALAKAQVAKAIAAEKKGLAEQAAKDAADKLEQQFADLIANLHLEVDRSALTKQLGDDLDALRDLKAGLERQVKAGVDVNQAQSQLVQVIGEIAAKQDEIRARAAEAVQARQFRALGLSAAGDEIVPGVENLQRQLRRLSARLADSGEQLPSKLTQQLEGARKVLTGKLGQVTKESRDKINELFKTIRSTFDQGARNAVPDRRTVQLSDRILAALGFGVDSDVSRLKKLGSASTIGGSGAFAKASVSPGTSFSGVTINGPITLVTNDPVAGLRSLQKAAGRTSATARGRFPGRSLGLG